MSSGERAALPRGAGSVPRLQAQRQDAEAAAAAAGDAVVGATPTCRICWEEADASPGGALLSGVCRCSGSLKFIHARCLLDWQRRTANAGTCATCQSPVILPPGLEARVKLTPMWVESARAEAGRLRTAPTNTLLRWWNHMVMSAGVAYGVIAAHQAWRQAPTLAWQLRERPLAARWQVLSTAAFAAAYSRVWAPAAAVDQRVGPWQQRFLRWHGLIYATGLAMDAGGAAALLRLALPPASGALAAAAAAAAATARVLLGLGIALQVAALHHLSPAMAFARGYSEGIGRAFGWTGLALAGLVQLLPGGSPLVALATRLYGSLPHCLHGLFRAAAMGLGGF